MPYSLLQLTHLLIFYSSTGCPKIEFEFYLNAEMKFQMVKFYLSPGLLDFVSPDEAAVVPVISGTLQGRDSIEFQQMFST